MNTSTDWTRAIHEDPSITSSGRLLVKLPDDEVNGIISGGDGLLSTAAAAATASARVSCGVLSR